ncbi:transporter [Roseateles sp. DAIF2]|uniref:transporter n=1 Tax=Roseateles sp. DAIF2 TaxID=2714952 RepID=UPI0018A2F9F8|nr:transporter [Roseateles sp. DAIF2]QPF76131.1 transporter [Roseateles sp. DAIF2]
MLNTPQPPAATLLPPTLPSYGADAHGLICGYRFRPGRAAEAIASAEAALPLAGAAPDEPGSFVWLHLNLSHAGAEAWMRTHAELPDSFYEALHEGSSRSTRIERDGDTLFAVINDITFDFSFDASDVATLWLAVGPGLVLSARRQPLRSVDRLRMAVKRGEPLASSVALLDHLLSDQADELQRIVRQATMRVDDIEDALLAGKHEGHGGEIARLRRLMVRLQRLLAPEPSALMRTLSRPPAWLASEDREQLRRASEEFALVLGDIAALQERIKLMQDESAARVAEDNNRSLFTLTMVTVLALPINLVSGLFGMNVGGIPLAEHGHGFWIMVSLIAGLTGLIAFLALRRMRR